MVAVQGFRRSSDPFSRNLWAFESRSGPLWAVESNEREKRLLVTDEPVAVQDFKRNSDHFQRIDGPLRAMNGRTGR